VARLRATALKGQFCNTSHLLIDHSRNTHAHSSDDLKLPLVTFVGERRHNDTGQLAPAGFAPHRGTYWGCAGACRMRTTCESAAASIAASASQIAAALSVLANCTAECNTKGSARGCDDSVGCVATDDARLLFVVHCDDAGGGAFVVTARRAFIAGLGGAAA
jgi:hypothetical protein